MKTIVVGFDDTDPARRALAWAAGLARAFGAKLIVTSVARVLAPPAAARGVGRFDPADPPLARARPARRAGVARGARVRRRVRRRPRRAGRGDLRLAEERGADLVVVGTHEPSLLERVLEVSVSAGVARHALCAVPIVETAKAKLAGLGVEASLVGAVGEPADAIVAIAEEHDAQLIVVGTREPGLLERLLGQSVSGEVQRKAHCDVLVVH